MKVNVKTEVIDVERNLPFLDEKGNPVTVGALITASMRFEGDSEKKELAYSIQKRISATKESGNDEVQISPEEAVYLKKAVSEQASAFAAGWFIEHINLL